MLYLKRHQLITLLLRNVTAFNINVYFLQLGKPCAGLTVVFDMQNVGSKHMWKPGKSGASYSHTCKLRISFRRHEISSSILLCCILGKCFV